MKLNGVAIRTFNSLKSWDDFDFQAFWERRRDFLALSSCQDGKVRKARDSFWDQPDLSLGQVVCDWLDSNVAPHEFKYFVENGNLYCWTGEAFAKQRQKVAEFGDGWNTIYVQLRASLCQKSAVGLVALYKLLNKIPNMNLCLSVVKGESMVEDDDVLYCSKDVQFGVASSDVSLRGKIMVNVSTQDIWVKMSDREQVALQPGECVTGIFQGNQCIELLPREGSNNRKQLALLFDLQRNISLLQVTDAKTYQSTTVENVLSFYLNEYGYAYVTCDGHVVVPEDEKYQVYDLYNYARDILNEHVIAVKSSRTQGGDEEYKIIYASASKAEKSKR